MKIALAMTWRLHSATLPRFQALLPLLQELYCGVSIVVSPTEETALIEQVRQLPQVKLRVGKAPIENRRYLTLQQALEFTDATHIHYCDGDHVLSRMEQFSDDWREILAALCTTDCLIVGRSPAVFDSYPPALRETEKIINQVGSYLLGQSVDLGAGARGFSRRAAEFLVRHAKFETHGVATDAEWVVLLQRAGFAIQSYVSAGAIYEIADENHRQRLESAEQWAKRVELARLIIQTGLETAQRNDIPIITQKRAE